MILAAALLLAGGVLALGALAFIAVNFVGAFRDPRFRTPNWLTRQAPEDEIFVPRDLPRLIDARELKDGHLRLSFSKDVSARAWRVFRDGQDLGETRHADIVFPEGADGSGPREGNVFRLEPTAGNAPVVNISVFLYPRTNYIKARLSWPNAYFRTALNLPLGYRGRPGYSLADWIGLCPDDPDLARARSAMQGEVDFSAPVKERQEAVFRFLMRHISHLDGLPDDALLNATPWVTWEKMRDGHKGFCECKAVIYYLFANAAGIPTRLVDLQGTVGAMVLTGHYFCESWIADEQAWVMVDPHNRNIAGVRDPENRLMHTLATKQRFDVGCLDGCSMRQYDRETKELVTLPLTALKPESMAWIRGQLVMGYKFGYPRNRGYSRLRAFFLRPTLLCSSLDLPRPRRGLVWALAAFTTGLLLLAIGLLSCL